MSIREWYDSEPMRQARMRMLGDSHWDHCRRCWHEESVSDTSRRHRSNQKSVLFRQNFEESYQQSPGWPKFEHSRLNQGAYSDLPVDLHIDLGNYCNLACKMCNPMASSTFATQYRKWGILADSLTDWTRDNLVWERFQRELLEIPEIKNIHFMGGETLIQPRFRELLDFLVENNRTDIAISFVTNGTSYDSDIVDRLKCFQQVGIEVSIESLDQINDYVRQGTNTTQVLEHLKRYQAAANNTTITVTLRPAPSALTVKSYWQVIEYAIKNQLIIKSNLVSRPEFQSILVLPKSVRERYQEPYYELWNRYEFDAVADVSDHNESDPNNFMIVAKNQLKQILTILKSPKLRNEGELMKRLVEHMQQWDQVYHFNARDVYPELSKELDLYGY